MKWKDVLGIAVIVLLVVVLALVLTRGRNPDAQAQRDIKNRIKQYQIVAEEQRLITEILTLKYEAAVIQSKFNPPQTAPPQNVPPIKE